MLDVLNLLVAVSIFILSSISAYYSYKMYKLNNPKKQSVDFIIENLRPSGCSGTEKRFRADLTNDGDKTLRDVRARLKYRTEEGKELSGMSLGTKNEEDELRPTDSMKVKGYVDRDEVSRVDKAWFKVWSKSIDDEKVSIDESVINEELERLTDEVKE